MRYWKLGISVCWIWGDVRWEYKGNAKAPQSITPFSSFLPLSSFPPASLPMHYHLDHPKQNFARPYTSVLHPRMTASFMDHHPHNKTPTFFPRCIPAPFALPLLIWAQNYSSFPWILRIKNRKRHEWSKKDETKYTVFFSSPLHNLLWNLWIPLSESKFFLSSFVFTRLNKRKENLKQLKTVIALNVDVGFVVG